MATFDAAKYAANFRQRKMRLAAPEPEISEPAPPVYTALQIETGRINDINMIEVLRHEWESRPRVILSREGE